MTEPAAELEPGEPLPVVRERAPYPRGAGVVVLAIVVAMLCGYVAILLARSYRAEREREQLACQVERLGGQPVGGVRCPPKARPHSSPRPAAPRRATPTRPAPGATMTFLVVLPGRTPAPAASPTSARPATSTRPSARPTRRPGATPSPSPVIRICLPSVPCLPGITTPATKETHGYRS